MPSNFHSSEERAQVVSMGKVHMHCDGCVDKIGKCVCHFPGVETVKVDGTSNRLIANGIVDPSVIRGKLQQMIKEVERLSPRPKKEENKKGKNPVGDEKPRELPVRTVVLKVNFQCEGCLDRIRRTVTKTRGVCYVSMDEEKEPVKVKGTMDVEELRGKLGEKLKRAVEVVAHRKVEDKGGNDCDCGERTCQDLVHYGYGYWYWMPIYITMRCGCGFDCNILPIQLHAPPPPQPPPLELFSDENANACSMM